MQTLGSTCCLVSEVWKRTCKSGFCDLQQMKTAQFTHPHKASQNQQCLSPTLARDPYKSYTWKNAWMSGIKGSETKFLLSVYCCNCWQWRGSLHCPWFPQWGYEPLVCLPRIEGNTWPHLEPLNAVSYYCWSSGQHFQLPSVSLVLMKLVRQSFWQKILIIFIHSLFQLYLWKIVAFYIASYKVSFNLMFWSWSQTHRQNHIKYKQSPNQTKSHGHQYKSHREHSISEASLPQYICKHIWRFSFYSLPTGMKPQLNCFW